MDCTDGAGGQSCLRKLVSCDVCETFGVSLRVLKNTAQAEEALQNTYLKIWRNASRYQVNGLSPMSWLITIARNTAVDSLRAQKNVEISGGSDLMDTFADSQPGPEDLAIANSENEVLRVCLAELDDAQAAAIRGAYLDGKTYAELASDAKVPLNTMRTWLRRSLIKLRECLTR
ncbi:sigma-70 family RNA polymerase sigma factor [Planktotalea sp.]|uniref:sigma-70 family RNA polymerase sigma factor n=1 Tax=Planktotalea sp. TaxID=2029877 RepID=UPI00344BCDE5